MSGPAGRRHDSSVFGLRFAVGSDLVTYNQPHRRPTVSFTV